MSSTKTDPKKKYVIKEATRKRCLIIPLDPPTLRRFCPISLESYHMLYQTEKIDFSLYVRIEDNMIEFIKPKELSEELLRQIWRACNKEKSDTGVYVLKSSLNNFHNTLDKVRKRKIATVLEKDPSLDRKTLNIFGDLSGASQMIIKGGINREVAQKATAVATYMITNLMDNELVMGTLSRMINIDPTLYDHSAAVAMFAGIMSVQNLKIPLTQKQSTLVTQCGLYHDTGKTCVPSCVLNKPGAFTPGEFEVMKTHASLGYDELIQAINKGAPIDDIVPRVAIEHHERFTGHGYPRKLKGRAEDDPEGGIHLFSRIVSIADAYSALLMKRVYKPALSPQMAIELMSKNAENDFDPEIFESFVYNVKKSIGVLDKNKKAKGNIFSVNDGQTIAEQIRESKK